MLDDDGGVFGDKLETFLSVLGQDSSNWEPEDGSCCTVPSSRVGISFDESLLDSRKNFSSAWDVSEWIFSLLGLRQV